MIFLSGSTDDQNVLIKEQIYVSMATTWLDGVEWYVTFHFISFIWHPYYCYKITLGQVNDYT
jgi:hypothetical protein